MCWVRDGGDWYGRISPVVAGGGVFPMTDRPHDRQTDPEITIYVPVKIPADREPSASTSS